MDKNQVILKVRDILDTKTGLNKISELEYEGEIYVDYQDMYLDKDSLKKYTQKSREYLENDIISWTCESGIYEYDYILKVIKDNLEQDIYD